MAKSGDNLPKEKMKVSRIQTIWVHREATIFNGVGTSTTSGKLKIPMAIRLQESDMVILGCTHSYDILKNTSFVAVSGVSAKPGMTKRV